MEKSILIIFTNILKAIVCVCMNYIREDLLVVKTQMKYQLFMKAYLYIYIVI